MGLVSGLDLRLIDFEIAARGESVVTIAGHHPEAVMPAGVGRVLGANFKIAVTERLLAYYAGARIRLAAHILLLQI
jgi:hypothetical protein